MPPGITAANWRVPALAGAGVVLVVALGAWWLLSPGPGPEPEGPVVATTEPEVEPDAAAVEPETEPAPAEPEPDTATLEPETEPDTTATPAEPDTATLEPETEPDTTAAPPEIETDAAATVQPEAETEATAPQPEGASDTAAMQPEAEPETAAPEPEAEAETDTAVLQPEAETEPETAPQPEAETETAALPPEPVPTLECAAGTGPGCALAAQALSALQPTAGESPKLVLNRPNGVYLDEEYLVIETELPPDIGGYLYLDVLTDAGNVYHLLPEPMRANNEVPAGGEIRVGVEEAERRDGIRFWQVGEPFGEGYLLALVSEKPLYQGLRPIEESIADYQDVLLEALADPETGKKSAQVERIEFRPRGG